MDNFIFNAPTKIYFGKGQVENLTKELKIYGKRVLLTYGGGSIKSSGLYQKIIENLSREGFEVFELSNIEPNPRIETVNKGIKICKSKKIDVVLAVGGGSTIDCSKVIAAGSFYQNDAWDLVMNSALIKKALPLVTILTLAATGSEMNRGAVISNMTLNIKKGTHHDCMIPKASFLDPEYTFTVPKYQTAAGVADILSHCFESYFKKSRTATLQDYIAEAVMKTCIKYGPIALEFPEDYEARANLMWASSLALNGLLGSGKNGNWSVHPIEHELSAFYDITHGIGLAIVIPRWMRYILSESTLDKFVEYGINVWDINPNLPKDEIANTAINLTEDFFFSKMGIPRTLPQVGILDQSNIKKMSKKAVEAGLANAYVSLNEDDVTQILKACY